MHVGKKHTKLVEMNSSLMLVADGRSCEKRRADLCGTGISGSSECSRWKLSERSDVEGLGRQVGYEGLQSGDGFWREIEM